MSDHRLGYFSDYYISPIEYPPDMGGYYHFSSVGYSPWYGILELMDLWNVDLKILASSLYNYRKTIQLDRIERLVFSSSLGLKPNQKVSEFFKETMSVLDKNNPIGSLLRIMKEHNGGKLTCFRSFSDIHPCQYEPIMIIFLRALSEKRKIYSDDDISKLSRLFSSELIDFEILNKRIKDTLYSE